MHRGDDVCHSELALGAARSLRALCWAAIRDHGGDEGWWMCYCIKPETWKLSHFYHWRSTVKKCHYFFGWLIPTTCFRIYQSNPFVKEGRSCAALDLEYGGKSMDIMTPQGFCHAMFQVLRLKEGSSLFLAPVCSSWVWVTLGASGKGCVCVLPQYKGFHVQTPFIKRQVTFHFQSVLCSRQIPSKERTTLKKGIQRGLNLSGLHMSWRVAFYWCKPM